ncbi:hypothetical protein P4H94_26985 [Paenibacillus macerans]|uniref:hypothetical protein n=1 Tax=Paenibacillus macerans TaxID=44252 RepID=UPI001F10DE2D|nr:hypothetical protein [Paenibacillus macerans]MBS5913492.1 hypothetical protein [Paenibacillus macerans]MDU5946247.1 hypothetical protein [Paenibacillus macerans]MEC0140493.1 hypothetical protein [Paenibacillus macerans]UMV45350.1 hypothetical protein LMZ02_17635 [Paenibacillus macerans]
MPRPESSIWGNILTCAEIALHVYEIIAEGNSGVAIDADHAKELLSEKALNSGEQHGGHVYFDDAKSVIPTYELLQKNAITDPEFKDRCGSAKQLAEEGKFFAPEYFGSLQAPENTPWGTVTNSQPLHNGLYFLESDGKWQLAVHQTAANHCLSDFAQEHAATHGEYLHYPLDCCAVPVYELSASHPAVMAQVVDEDSLLHTLCLDEPLYVAMHNQHTEEWGHIHDCPAPKSMFLQLQLDQVAEQAHKQEYHTPHAANNPSLITLCTNELEPDDFFEPTEELEL